VNNTTPDCGLIPRSWLVTPTQSKQGRQALPWQWAVYLFSVVYGFNFSPFVHKQQECLMFTWSVIKLKTSLKTGNTEAGLLNKGSCLARTLGWHTLWIWYIWFWSHFVVLLKSDHRRPDLHVEQTHLWRFCSLDIFAVLLLTSVVEQDVHVFLLKNWACLK